MRLTILLLLIGSTIYGQYDHESVFPDLENDELNSALIDNFKPTISLSLSETRDTLYKKVFLHKDSVRCVYTTMAKFLDLNEDPSQYLFEEGGSDDLNLEHGFPQAKGAGFGAAQADMHHLFPSRVMVNSRRGNDPYVELDDNDVDTWYYKEEERTSRPNSNVIDQYSEDMHLGFEPREDFKGNVARAYFYFYTMYKQQADAEDPVFFSSQVETLCDWHDLDPVDSLEWARTYKIANYQDDKPNPFVLDCRLARLYCNSISQACRTLDTEELFNSDSKLVLSPNPIEAGGRIGLSIGADLGQGIFSGLQAGRAVIFDFQGRQVSDQVLDGDFEIFAPREVGYYQVFIFDKGVVVGRRSLVVY